MIQTSARKIQKHIGILVGGASIVFALSNTFYTYIVYAETDFSFSHVFTRIYLLLIIGVLAGLTALKDNNFLRFIQVLFFILLGAFYVIINTSGDLGGILFFVYAILLAFQYKFLKKHFLFKSLLFILTLAAAQLISYFTKPEMELSHGIASIIFTLVFFYMINLLFSEEIRAYKTSAEEIQREYDSNRIHIKTGKNLTGVVHNIKSKLTSVMGFNELIREEAEDIQKEELTEYAGLQHQAISQIIGQVQSLLFTVANSEDAAVKPLSLNPMLDGTIELIKAFETVRHELDITRDLSDDDAVYISPLYLVEIIENIIRNSLEAAPEGRTPAISITSRKKGPFLVLSFADNGSGIEEYYGRGKIDCLAEEVFKPGKTTKAMGSGIGMSSVVEMLKAMGGGLYLTTGPEGTTIDVCLPAEEGAALTKS